jgi:hypothetical protein
VTIHPKRIRWMKNPWDVVIGFKHDNRLKCHRGIVSQWTFQVGLNVTVDETWVDVTSRHLSDIAVPATKILYQSAGFGDTPYGQILSDKSLHQ